MTISRRLEIQQQIEMQILDKELTYSSYQKCSAPTRKRLVRGTAKSAKRNPAFNHPVRKRLQRQELAVNSRSIANILSLVEEHAKECPCFNRKVLRIK